MNGKILIVDDEANIRSGLSKLLSREGHHVETVEDFDSALEAISKVRFDLIFVDVFLGNHSGIEILKEVSKQGLNCPVIVMTGHPDLKNAAESVRLGAFDFLSKPILTEKFLHTAKMAIQHKTILEERNRITKEKERCRQHFEAIFSSVKEGIYTINPDMEVINVNESMRRICGIGSEEIVGKNFKEASNLCDKRCYEVLSETINKKKTVKEYRIECNHRSRKDQVVVLSSSPLFNQRKKLIGTVLVIRDVTRLEDLERELMEKNQFQGIVGKNEKMKKIYKLLEDLAETNTTVLVRGESGTGKELIANALHFGGIRSGKPIVKVNCSALSENLLESELFGHVKGAFTGAVKNKQGRFLIANKGSIFLDEIGDISPRIQLKLLRVLQEKEIELVGDSTPVKVDVRIIASTNCDLLEKVRLGEFRKDLYYRLKVVEIKLPPLRERREDIPHLIEHFCRIFNKDFKKNIDYVSEETLDIFMKHQWPGNIRELRHVIEHAFVICKSRLIQPNHLPPEFESHIIEDKMGKEKLSENDSEVILQSLEKTGWNKAKAARLLGISRQTIYRKMTEHGIIEPNL